MENKKLNELVVGIELTLVSVVQGLALVFLAEGAVEPMVHFHPEFWPYILSGFLLILYFWSQAIMHTLSFIRWPINFGHNFLYFLIMFFEAIAFNQISNPKLWFLFHILFFITGWILYRLDLYLINQVLDGTKNKEEKQLLLDVRSDQIISLKYLVPLGIVYSIVACYFVSYYPDVFLVHHWHILLGIGQALLGVVTLLYGMKKFSLHAKMLEKVKVY